MSDSCKHFPCSKCQTMRGINKDYCTVCQDFEPKNEDDDKNYDTEERYRLTPWGCLSLTLMDYNVDIDHITPKMGEHMVEDFMKLMETAGHVCHCCEDDGK